MATAPVFWLADAAARRPGDRADLTGDEGRHAADVRRMRIGEPVDLTDGLGTLLHGTVVSVRRGALAVDVESRLVVPAPQPRLVVAQALARGGRDEVAVEAMTEVGVDEVVGWSAQRCVARWTDRTGAKWSATVRSAAKQSRRARWPTVSGPASTDELAARCRTAALALVLHETADQPLASLAVPAEGEIVAVVGPEGGITDEELTALKQAGAAVVRLGDTVLRSSTAGVAALAVLCAGSRWRGTTSG